MSAWFKMRDSIVGNDTSVDKSVDAFATEQRGTLSTAHEEGSRASNSAVMRASVSMRAPKVRELPEVDEVDSDDIDFDFGR